MYDIIWYIKSGIDVFYILSILFVLEFVEILVMCGFKKLL